MARDLRSWSDDDENYIQRNRRCVTAADLAFHFGVTQKAMESKLRRMGVRKVSRVTHPEPGILWELSRAVLTDSETRGIRVASTAAELGLHWPVARRGETVGDYAGLKWEQLIDCPGLGRKKIDVLLSCFMTLAAARGVELPAAPLAGVPELSEAFRTWESCRNIVHEHDAGHHNISEWAEAVGERWPASRSGETFSVYVELDWPELASRPGFGPKKLGALLEAIKALTLVLTGDAAAPARGAFRQLRSTPGLSSEWDEVRTPLAGCPLALLTVDEVAKDLGRDWNGDSKRCAIFADLLNHSLSKVTARNKFDTQQTAVLLEAVRYLHRNREALTTDFIDRWSQLGTARFARWILDRTPQRRAVVLRHRFGIGTSPKILEEVGTLLGVTRERARQVEGRSISWLEGMLPRAVLMPILESSVSLATQDLFGPALTIPPDAVRDRDDRLPGSWVFLAVVASGGCKKSLGMCLPQWRGHLLPPNVDVTCLDDVEAELTSWSNDRPLPAQIPDLETGGRLERATAWEVIRGVQYHFQGYACPAKTGPRLRRAIHLHKALLQIPQGASTYELLQVVARLGEHCSFRDAEIVMSSYPHLFIKAGDIGWLAVGECQMVRPGAAPTRLSPVWSAPPDLDPGAPSRDGSIRSRIRGYFSKVPAATLSDLREALEIDTASVGPVLSTNGDFVRLAPGLYGLYRDLLSEGFNESIAEKLLTRIDCCYYIWGRRSGLPYFSFPYWSPRMEARWCQWAKEQLGRQEGSRQIAVSLLAVAQPLEWPGISDPMKAQWQDRKIKLGRHALPVPEPRFEHEFSVSPRDFLSLIRRVVADGGLSWMSVNRVLGLRIDTLGSASLLGSLARLRVIISGSDWQDWQPIGPNANQWRGRLESEMASSGELFWDHGGGRAMADAVKDATPPDGWARRALARIIGADRTVVSPSASTGSAELSVESILESTVARRREESLRKLLGDLLDG